MKAASRRGRAVLGPLAFVVLLAFALAAPAAASAKERGLQTPTGRAIYDSEETFEDTLTQENSFFAAELAVGEAAEGNLAAGLGVLVPGTGLEFWAHFGLEGMPALHYSLAARYVFGFGEFRPYLGVGVVLADGYSLGTLASMMFAEIGHQFRIHETYRISAAIGFRYTMNTWLKDDSSLSDGTTDPVWVEEQLAAARGAFITLTLRFSRAF